MEKRAYTPEQRQANSARALAWYYKNRERRLARMREYMREKKQAKS